MLLGLFWRATMAVEASAAELSVTRTAREGAVELSAGLCKNLQRCPVTLGDKKGCSCFGRAPERATEGRRCCREAVEERRWPRMPDKRRQ